MKLAADLISSSIEIDNTGIICLVLDEAVGQFCGGRGVFVANLNAVPLKVHCCYR